MLGGHEIARLISEGVAARYNDEGVQITVPQEGEEFCGIEKDGIWKFPLIQHITGNTTVEGCSFDLRLGSLFKRVGKASLLVNSRNTGRVVEAKGRTINEQADCFFLNPGEYYLASTIEWVNMPLTLRAGLVPRTTMFRSGICVLCSAVGPNYFGPLTVGLINLLKDEDIMIQKGFRIISIDFIPLTGKSDQYSGNWQGGKVSTNGKVDPPR